MGRPAINLAGQVFGRLTVIDRAPRRAKPGPARWNCVCSCGGATVVDAYELRRGQTSSCGCLGREHLGAWMRTHGMSATRMFGIWAGMWARCRNPATRGFYRYGGRGIRVCDRWKDFALFYRDMGERPAGMTLDRRDNDGNYEPGNCRWATRREQSSNRACTTVLVRAGEAKRLTEWADALGLSQKTIHTRLLRGWSHEEALAPARRRA